jgi:uncharacterized protein YcbK (DUF882 family)
MSSIPLNRRALLAGCGALVLMPAAALARPMTPQRIRLRNAHTGESFDGLYRDADGPLPDAMEDLAQFLRDHRANKVGPVDVGALDLLAEIMEAVAQSRATVLSAFRTPETNGMLRKLGAAEHSQHLLGKALDVTFPSRLPDAHRKALELKRGGVGWYPRSFFLHIDTGPVRSWETFGGNLDHLFAPGTSGRLRTVAERMRLHRAIARRRLSAAR